MGRKKTHTEFVGEMKIINPEITVISEYVSARTLIKFKHICGYEWERKARSCNVSCPKCARVLKKTTETYNNEIEDKTNKEYSVLKYINAKTKIKFKHNICGSVFYRIKFSAEKTINNSHILCPKCSNITYKLDSSKMIEKINNTEYGEYLVLDESIENTSAKINLLHKKCNNFFKVNYNHFIHFGSRCPRCNESKGEKFLSKVLKSNNIPFVPQYNLVKNPKTNRWLKSDFVILNKEKEPILILEYDGIQHFKVIDIFGGKEALKSTQYRDSVKDEYCKENNIPFIRFNYKQSENDITNLLLKQLKKMKLI